MGKVNLMPIIIMKKFRKILCVVILITIVCCLEGCTITKVDTEKTPVSYVRLSYGPMENKEKVIEQAFNDLSIDGETVIGDLQYEGKAMFMAYKYPGGMYGMMQVQWYSEPGQMHILNVIDGKYYHNLK